MSTRLGAIDLHLVGEGRHERLYEKLGAHAGDDGVAFAVWAPNASKVAVVGEWNAWDGRVNEMAQQGASGIWEAVVPDAPEGALYRYEITTREGHRLLKSDPFAFAAEMPPGNASRIFRSRHEWSDDEWVERRRAAEPWSRPMSVYEVHLGSWRRTLENEPLDYRTLAAQLGTYANDMGFTHVELLPVMEHPYSGSWGYQVTGYFAPTARFGDPDDFRAFVDELHRHDVGVILDWVPAHFPRDDWALARFDGTALYEHEDPRRGAHPDWGTLVFNYGRNEVRNFLLANALYWLREFHADGLRVDAVASMLYLDYSRREGEWVPNEFGGREDLQAVSFLQELNEVVHGREPGVISAAEESTAWPGVSRPVYLGGLGFGFKWNMGWMHDTLDYFEREPIHRRYHHHQLTFSLMYAFSENFILPLSHDEVVHLKSSLLGRMPGDRWQQLANLRLLFSYMWLLPGKKLLFMGGELAHPWEWDFHVALPWYLLEHAEHRGV
ncbi:MAG TPA: 1,4-alpha-glucan branching protein GlgB, partial [Agromyces sp.]|nr:1,4-alpha-glucan branching protein GlgB [Agromyces sp.]